MAKFVIRLVVYDTANFGIELMPDQYRTDTADTNTDTNTLNL